MPCSSASRLVDGPMIFSGAVPPLSAAGIVSKKCFSQAEKWAGYPLFSRITYVQLLVYYIIFRLEKQQKFRASLPSSRKTFLHAPAPMILIDTRRLPSRRSHLQGARLSPTNPPGKGGETSGCPEGGPYMSRRRGARARSLNFMNQERRFHVSSVSSKELLRSSSKSSSIWRATGSL